MLLCLQIQAHVAQTEVDPGAAVAWLRVTDDGLQASSVTTQLMRYCAGFATWFQYRQKPILQIQCVFCMTG